LAIFLKKIYSKEDESYLYGYDLTGHPYLGSEFIVTVGLDLDGLSLHEALESLYKFRGTIYRFKSRTDCLKIFDTKLSGNSIKYRN